MRELWPFVRLLGRRGLWFLLGGALSCLTVLAGVGLLALSGWFITASALAGLGSVGAAVGFDIFRPGAGIRFFALARTASRYGERLANHEATFRALADLRVRLFGRLRTLSPAALGRLRGGDVLNRLTADVDALDNLYLRVLAPTVVAAITGLAAFVVLYVAAPPVALAVVAVFVGAGLLVPTLAGWLGRRPGRRIAASTAALRLRAADGVRGLADLLVYRRAEAHGAELDAAGADLVGAQARMGRIGGLTTALAGLSANLAAWLALVVGLVLVERGAVGPAVWVLLVFTALGAFEALAPLPAAYQFLGRTRASAVRLTRLAEDTTPVTEPERPRPLPAATDLRFEAVRFRYGPASPEVLQGLDLALPEGQRLGLIGPSGGGKSTLIALALRLWDPASGVVRLGGADLRGLGVRDLRRRFAWLSQRPRLFDASVADNLRLAAPDAPDAALWRALEAAGLAEAVARLPGELEAPVGEGAVRLSGGQARRLALARAVLKDAPVWLLDEPTEGLDADTERDLLASLLPAMRGRSVLVATHRLAALRDLDAVATLEGGRIIASGPPDRLDGGEALLRPRAAGDALGVLG